MNKDRFSLYNKVSPSKSNKNLSYLNQLDNLDTDKSMRHNLLTEGKENGQPLMTAGVRDVLLVKCKQAIEELHSELEGEKKLRQQIEESLAEAETENHEKDSELREMRFQQEKQIDEIRGYRVQNEGLRKQLEHTEDDLKIYTSKETAHQHLQKEYQSLQKANNEFKTELTEMSAELDKRDKIIKQWNDTLGSVQEKIVVLERENNELKEEYQGAVDENEKLRRIVDESENTNSLLQEKYEAIERLTQQLQKENKVIESLRDQNEELREQVKNQERKMLSLTEDSHLNKLQLEEHFVREREDLENSIKEKHRRKLNEVQDSLNSEIFRLKEAHEMTKSDFYKVKTERDLLKQEASRLEERLEKVELESRKLSNSFTANYENLAKNKSEEIERLKGMNDDQSKLINSYEKIIEKERIDSSNKITDIMDGNTRLKGEVVDLKTKNEYLNNKLRECQEELSHLRKEVHHTFTEEEEKQGQLVRKMGDLEVELVDRNIHHMRNIEKRQSEEIELLEKARREAEEELGITKNQVIQLIEENDQLRDKQKEFYEILQGKIGKISEELKQEREKRLHAQNICQSQEERLRELEAKLKGPTKSHLYHSEAVYKDPSNQSTRTTPLQHEATYKRHIAADHSIRITPQEADTTYKRSSAEQSLRSTPLQADVTHKRQSNDPSNRNTPFEYDQHKKPSSHKGDHLEYDSKRHRPSVENSKRDSVNKEHHHHHHHHHGEAEAKPKEKERSFIREEKYNSEASSKRRGDEHSFNQPKGYADDRTNRVEERHEHSRTHGRRSPKDVSSQFLNRFKTVIERLENKLEHIAADIESSN